MDGRYDEHLFRLLVGSYEALTGKRLTPVGMDAKEGARWLYEEAPFGVLAHNTAADPVFVYGNRAAQRRFEYTWEELTALPSRLSAEAPERSERQLKARVVPGQSLEDAREARLAQIPLKRMTQPEEIASMAALIVSDRMASMTGGEVLIDGGVMPAV